MGMASFVRHAQCNATGDIWHSNDMIVDGPGKWPNSWDITSAVDHHTYTIVLCPPSPLKLQAGNYIEHADYEYRDGCWDFSSEKSSYKVY